MASASTANLGLPLIQPTDYPTWQGDFNMAMNTLDEAIHALEPSQGQYQEELKSGVNIQTIGGHDILAPGNLSFKTINNNSIFGEGNINIDVPDVSNFQPKLQPGVNIVNINNDSILTGGNLSLQETLRAGQNIKNINGQSILGSGNISISAPSITAIPALTAQNTSALTVPRGTMATMMLTGPQLAPGDYYITFSGVMTAQKASSTSLFEVKVTYAISPNASTSTTGYTQAIDLWGNQEEEFTDPNVPVPFTYSTIFTSNNANNQPFMQVGYQAAAGSSALTVSKAMIIAIPITAN